MDINGQAHEKRQREKRKRNKGKEEKNEKEEIESRVEKRREEKSERGEKRVIILTSTRIYNTTHVKKKKLMEMKALWDVFLNTI